MEGATADALDEDARLWMALGGAIGELAWRVRRSCAASAFCEARPSAALVAARLAEAIDDQFDGPAWAVINAAAQARAREMGERTPAT